MTDLVLPASAPIETYIDETVSVLAELLEDTPKEVLAGFDFSVQGVWAFARPVRRRCGSTNRWMTPGWSTDHC